MNKFCVTARFIALDSPAPYERMRARLWDQDLVNDDLLGESTIDSAGCISIQFDMRMTSSIDSPGEVRPDLYIQILIDDVEIYRTPVKKDVCLIANDSNVEMKSVDTLNLGEFHLPDLRGLDPLTRREFFRTFVEPS